MTQGWGKHFSNIKAAARNARGVGNRVDQTLFVAASTPVNYPEYEMAGSLRRRAGELVKCELSDSWSASAEIVLEGYVSADPTTFTLEGPFKASIPVITAAANHQAHHSCRCITHRNDPISRLLDRLEPGKNQRGDDLDAGDVSRWPALSRAGRRAEHYGCGRQVPETNARADSQVASRPRAASRHCLWGVTWENYAAKHVIVVDDDIDIHDWEAIEWRFVIA